MHQELAALAAGRVVIIPAQEALKVLEETFRGRIAGMRFVVFGAFGVQESPSVGVKMFPNHIANPNKVCFQS